MDDPGAAGPLEQILDGLAVAVAVVDRDGRIQTSNPRAREILTLLGIGPGAGRGPVADVEVVDEHGDPVAPELRPPTRTLTSGLADVDVLLGLRRHEAIVAWVRVSAQPIVDPADASARSVVCTFVDVTEERNAQVALRDSEERFRLLAENAIDVIYRLRVGSDPRFEYVNPAVETLLGYSPDDFYAEPGLVLDILHPDDRDPARALGRDGTGKSLTMLLRMTRRDGIMIWTEHRVAPVRDPHGTIVVVEGIARDVTARKVKEAVLNHRALHDPLTGLANRVLLLDRLEHALARTRRYPAHLAVLYLDLDRFKTVNDNLGHEVGDRLLRVVARRLQETIRPSDSVARLGGDEFAAVLPDLRDAEEALQIAERLLSVIAEPIDLGEGALVTTVSIGLVGADEGAASAAELLRRADFAMYAAKDRGRARVERYETLGAAEAPPPAR